ncbi:hypothetical protein E7Z59_07155 [Robertkochia marina]|uniref:Uncharacterized protein n=1 Tax=Robertkochia marina TaxID=1227945 RepID=A0A4S3M0E4_9FLAO|nr:hypothetical protein [Robertkochia marina]THD67433.1 hypothetical protein E7Z59_07155 [Robertkochia marina]TRZ40781.1 hypothetical protein D3A96_15375 [Robertkochia marina]
MKLKEHAIWNQLRADEVLEAKLNKTTGLQFRNEDFLHFLLFTLGILGLTQFLPAYLNGNEYLFWLVIVSSLMIIKSSFSLVLRWIKIKRLEYLITNKRLIIYNKSKDQILKSFPFNDFPRMVLRENAYNSGFIILGEYDKFWESDPKDKFEWGKLILRKRSINLDYRYTLDNIPEVKKVYQELLSKIEKKANST